MTVAWGRAVADRIGQHVNPDLFEAIGVAEYERQARCYFKNDLDLVFIGQTLPTCQHFFGDDDRIGGDEWQISVHFQPMQFQQIAHQPRHAAGFVFQGCKRGFAHGG